MNELYGHSARQVLAAWNIGREAGTNAKSASDDGTNGLNVPSSPEAFLPKLIRADFHGAILTGVLLFGFP
jgi:hypothetical protein